MKHIYFSTLLTFITCILSAQDPLPRGMTKGEKAIWPEYIKNLSDEKGTEPPLSPPRTPGEWEEMQGVVITWAAYTSELREIVRYAKEVVKVYIICSNPSSVQNYLNSGGVSLSNIEFITAGFNSVWVRDYGPQSVYLHETSELAIVDWVYNRPRPSDDEIPSVIANHLDLPIYQMTASPNMLVATGGNFMADGFGKGFSSKLIIDENEDLNENVIYSIVDMYMGVDPYILMNTLPYDGIHHIDMHMKLLDEETLLVGEYPLGVSDGPQIEENLNFILDNYKTPYGRDFKVIRIPMPPNEYGYYPSQMSDYLTYTNSVILNRLVLVPIYGLQQDEEALEVYRKAMPGYDIVGLNMRNVIPASGAIHCITKEIAAEDPIFISHAPFRDKISFSETNFQVKAHITSASGINDATLFWSTDTTNGFSPVSMSFELDTFRTEIPSQSIGSKIFYYISATNGNEKTVNKPLVAPKGLYVFEIEPATAVNDISNQENISVFPNPAKDFITISFENTEKTAEIIVVSSTGNITKNFSIKEGQNKSTLDISQLPAGLYLVVIKNRARILRTKFLKN